MLHVLSGSTHFRHVTGVAFVFLLVALASIVCGQRLLESVLLTHVREMVSREVRTQQVISGLDNAQQLADTLKKRTDLPPRRERTLAVVSANGQALYGDMRTLAEGLCPTGLQNCQGWQRASFTTAEGDVEMLGQVLRLADGGHYAVAYDILPMVDRVHPIPLTAGVSIFVVLLVTLGSGLYLSLDGMRHIERIRKAMRSYARGDLQARVPRRQRHDEFDHLGEDINKALLRITRLVDEVRHATNHIAHELRTPLTRLQQRLSSANDSAESDTTRHEIELAEDEAMHIQRLFRAVMRISEIETGRCAHDFIAVGVRALFVDLADYYEVLAEERGTRLTIESEVALTVPGDHALLFQALVNLIDNALKYAPRGGQVTLIARRSHDGIELCVGDDGPGIDADRRTEAVQRFRRLSKDRSIPGHGLGLSLVQAVAELHGGVFELRDNRATGLLPGMSGTVQVDAPPRDAQNVAPKDPVRGAASR